MNQYHTLNGMMAAQQPNDAYPAAGGASYGDMAGGAGQTQLSVAAPNSVAPYHIPVPNGTLQMDSSLSEDAIDAPLSREEAQVGSLRALLRRNLGNYVVASFLIGIQSFVSWEGYLYAVGNDYLVIYQPDMGRYVTCDLYSVKFVEFYDEKGMTLPCTGLRRRDANSIR